MRILHCISSIDPRAGGPVTAVAGLARAQVSAGMEVCILATYRAGADESLAEQLRAQSVRVKRIGPCHGPLNRHPDLIRAVRGEVASSDVVHIHGLWEEIQHQSATAARWAGKPYIVTPHGMLTRWSMAQSRLKKKLYLLWRLRRILGQAAALHFTTANEEAQSAALVGKVPSMVVPLGVDLREFEVLPPAGTFRNAWGIPTSRPLIVFLGRIHPGKGLEYLIPALAKLKNTQAMVAVVGPDSAGYRAQVEQTIARLGLVERVLFTGMLSGAARLAPLVDTDLFCMPSDHENFGLSVVEALAAGTPVIISDQVNIHREISAAGVGGVVPTDAEALATELDRWLASEAMRQEASRRAGPFLRKHYDWDQIGVRWRALYADRIMKMG